MDIYEQRPIPHHATKLSLEEFLARRHRREITILDCRECYFATDATYSPAYGGFGSQPDWATHVILFS